MRSSSTVNKNTSTIELNEVGHRYNVYTVLLVEVGYFVARYFRLFKKVFKKKKLHYGPFLWGSTASRLEPLRGGNLLFTTKFPGIPGTHFIDLGRMKG